MPTRVRDYRWMYGLLLVASFSWNGSEAQTRYGAAIFIQATQPTTGTYPGALWYDTTADTLKIQKNNASWVGVGGSGGLPSGAIVLIDSGACPAGTTEIAAMNGVMPLGTLNANANVGTTGGTDTVSAVLNHTHTVSVNDPGHQHGMAEGQTDGAGTLMDRSNAASAAATLTDSAVTGVTATTQNPAGGVASFDNRSAFRRVIYCKAS